MKEYGPLDDIPLYLLILLSLLDNFSEVLIVGGLFSFLCNSFQILPFMLEDRFLLRLCKGTLTEALVGALFLFYMILAFSSQSFWIVRDVGGQSQDPLMEQ